MDSLLYGTNSIVGSISKQTTMFLRNKFHHCQSEPQPKTQRVQNYSIVHPINIPASWHWLTAMCPITCGLYLNTAWWWQAQRASYCVWEGDVCVGALGVLVHTQDVCISLLWFGFPEDVFHGWLEVIGDKAIDNGVHAAIEATQSHCHVVDEEADVVGHVWVDGDCNL